MLLSIIVPVHQVEAYLPECLDSIRDQDFTDFELIAIDDHSPDGSGQILDRYAETDDRVEVIHLDDNVGLGAARNVGIDRARGDYLLFLDSDDSLAPDALTAIAERLTSTSRPDVLIFDHTRTYPDGREQRNVLSRVLVELAGEEFTAEDHPEIFQLLQVAWNKAYRRDFVTELGLRFPAGYYEDTAWTHILLLSARTIVTLPVVCVRYRQRASGSILSSRSRRHFDAIDQWQRLFDHLDDHPELASWRPLILQRAIDHYAKILITPHRLSPSDRRAFHRAATAHVESNLGSTMLPSQGRREDLKRWLLLHADLRVVQSVWWLDERRTRARRLVRRVARRISRTADRGRRDRTPS